MENFVLQNKQKFNIKLIDFGLACSMKQGKKIFGLPVGTPYYIAPELLMAESDCKSDVWSAGVILFMLITGRPPFDGLTDKEIINEIKYREPNYFLDEFRNTSPDCQDLIKKML